MNRTPLGLLALSLVAACGGNVVIDTGSGMTSTGGSSTTSSGTPGTVLSCDLTTAGIHICESYANVPAAELSTVESVCTGTMNVVGTLGTGCSSTNRLGTCALSGGGLMFGTAYYSGDGITAAMAQMACTAASGSWTAG